MARLQHSLRSEEPAGAAEHPPAKRFAEYFSVVLADTPELKAEVYRIRYEVYCREFGYEPIEDFPDGKERDAYDPRSVHCLVVHRRTGAPAGCVRMVPTDPNAPHAPLPFENCCADSLDRKQLDGLQLPRSTVCEISRLAVPSAFRRRRGESESRYGSLQGWAGDGPTFTPEEQRCVPLIAFSLYLAATAITDMTNRRNVFAMMEPFLPRHLSRVGIHFTQVGRVLDHHGKRAAYFIRTDSALQDMKPELRGLYDTIHHNLKVASDQTT